MKFVLFKGLEGFGDRIQCLLQVMKYSIFTNRILIIDWTDDHWGDYYNNIGFENFFYFDKIKFMKYTSFKILYYLFQENNIKIDIFPKLWENKLFNKYGLEINNKEYYIEDNNTGLEQIIQKKKEDFKEQIVVYVGVKNRTFEYCLFRQHIRIKSNILIKIYNTTFYKDIIKNNIKYTCIHLRGGDRMKKNFNDTNYIENYLLKIIKDIDYSIKHILIITDTTLLIKKFKEMLSIKKDLIIYETNNTKIDKNIGLHKTKLNITITQRNIEMLKDFYFFTKAYIKISDNISQFSRMGKKVSFIQ